MLTPFDQIEARGLRAQQGVFGTPIQIIPMKDRPNKRPVRDHSREVMDICGTFVIAGTLNDMDKNSRIDRAGRKGSMSFNNISTKNIRLNLLLCDLAYIPKQFDAVIRLSDGQVYEVMDISPSGHSDINFLLNEVEGPYGHT